MIIHSYSPCASSSTQLCGSTGSHSFCQNPHSLLFLDRHKAKQMCQKHHKQDPLPYPLSKEHLPRSAKGWCFLQISLFLVRQSTSHALLPCISHIQHRAAECPSERPQSTGENAFLSSAVHHQNLLPVSKSQHFFSTFFLEENSIHYCKIRADIALKEESDG